MCMTFLQINQNHIALVLGGAAVSIKCEISRFQIKKRHSMTLQLESRTCRNVTKGLLGLLSRIRGHLPDAMAR
jgi:hypothetical protein